MCDVTLATTADMPMMRGAIIIIAVVSLVLAWNPTAIPVAKVAPYWVNMLNLLPMPSLILSRSLGEISHSMQTVSQCDVG